MAKGCTVDSLCLFPGAGVEGCEFYCFNDLASDYAEEKLGVYYRMMDVVHYFGMSSGPTVSVFAVSAPNSYFPMGEAKEDDKGRRNFFCYLSVFAIGVGVVLVRVLWRFRLFCK